MAASATSLNVPPAFCFAVCSEKEQAKDKLPETSIEVLDSQNVTAIATLGILGFLGYSMTKVERVPIEGNPHDCYSKISRGKVVAGGSVLTSKFVKLFYKLSSGMGKNIL